MSYANLKCPYCCVCDTYINGEVVQDKRGDTLFLFHEQCFIDSKREPKFGEILDVDGTLD